MIPKGSLSSKLTLMAGWRRSRPRSGSRFLPWCRQPFPWRVAGSRRSSARPRRRAQGRCGRGDQGPDPGLSDPLRCLDDGHRRQGFCRGAGSLFRGELQDLGVRPLGRRPSRDTDEDEDDLRQPGARRHDVGPAERRRRAQGRCGRGDQGPDPVVPAAFSVASCRISAFVRSAAVHPATPTKTRTVPSVAKMVSDPVIY
jgi:hypothetical protein